MILAPFGGATGELTAAMQYSVRCTHCDDPGIQVSSAAPDQVFDKRAPGR